MRSRSICRRPKTCAGERLEVLYKISMRIILIFFFWIIPIVRHTFYFWNVSLSWSNKIGGGTLFCAEVAGEGQALWSPLPSPSRCSALRTTGCRELEKVCPWSLPILPGALALLLCCMVNLHKRPLAPYAISGNKWAKDGCGQASRAWAVGKKAKLGLPSSFPAASSG